MNNDEIFFLVMISMFGVISSVEGNDTLISCIERGDIAGVKRRIIGGEIINKEGATWTPLMIAAINGKKEIVKLLLESGANPNLKGRENGKPLAILA